MFAHVVGELGSVGLVGGKVGNRVYALPSDQSERLLRVLAGLAAAEENPARQEFLESFPFAIGMGEEQES
ncbi:hypothetical protein AB0919_33325 [Streptomyces sp. NPDC046994]|uniref:hypothetical protein n=1 Tax=Streptomyces sp. NPDC046994 TaxID=3155735 RepID=UPI00345122B4